MMDGREFLGFDQLVKHTQKGKSDDNRAFVAFVQGTGSSEINAVNPSSKKSEVHKQIVYYRDIVELAWQRNGKQTSLSFNRYVLNQMGVYRILSSESKRILVYHVDSEILVRHLKQRADSASSDMRIKTIQDFQNQLRDSLHGLCQANKSTKGILESKEEEVENFKRFVKEKKEEVLKVWQPLKDERASIQKKYEEDVRTGTEAKYTPLETRYLTQTDLLFRRFLLFTMGNIEAKNAKYKELSYIFKEIDTEELVKKTEEFIEHYLESGSILLPHVFQSQFKKHIYKLDSEKGNVQLPKRQDEVKETKSIETLLISPGSPKRTKETPDEETEKFRQIVEKEKAPVLRVWQSMQPERARIEKEYEDDLKKEYKKNQENINESIERQKEIKLRQKYLDSSSDKCFKQLLLLTMGNISENDSLELVMQMDSGELVKRMEDFIHFYFKNHGPLSIKDFKTSFKNYILELNKGNDLLIEPPKPVVIEPEKKQEEVKPAVREVHQSAWQGLVNFFQWLREKFNQYFCACCGSKVEVQNKKQKSNMKGTPSSDKILVDRFGPKPPNSSNLFPEIVSPTTRSLFNKPRESKRDLTLKKNYRI